MSLSKRLGIALLLPAVVAAAVFASVALGAPRRFVLSFVVQNRGIDYITLSRSTTVFPGSLQIGDRIIARDALLQGTRTVGYDNELCTVTFEDNDLCQVIEVIPGRGQIEASWLWIDRNASQYGPSHFTGVIDGGTGAFANARGQFVATLLPSGAPMITVTLDR
jgi:hypothetical protein